MAASRSIGVTAPVTGIEEDIVEEVVDAIVEEEMGHTIKSLFAYALTISTYDIVGMGIFSQLRFVFLLESRSLKNFPI